MSFEDPEIYKIMGKIFNYHLFSKRSMQEKSIITAAYIIMILGFVFLMIYSNEIDLNNVENLDSIPISEEIKIAGIINKITIKDKATFITITGKKTETIDIILFSNKETILKAGDEVEISGIVEEYKGRKEII